jgi:hypothetical protein
MIALNNKFLTRFYERQNAERHSELSRFLAIRQNRSRTICGTLPICENFDYAVFTPSRLEAGKRFGLKMGAL